MGSLFFGGHRLRIDIDDVHLQALEMIAVSKMRRSEAFLLSWHDSGTIGDGRSSIVITPSSELHFKYAGSKVIRPPQDLLEHFAQAANSTGGISIEAATLAEPAVT